MLHQAERHGARDPLFGREIQLAEDARALVTTMRAVTNGDLPPDELSASIMVRSKNPASSQ